MVLDYQKAVVLRFGKAKDVVSNSGLLWIVPCSDDVTIIDMRTICIDLPPQEVSIQKILIERNKKNSHIFSFLIFIFIFDKNDFLGFAQKYFLWALTEIIIPRL